MKIDLLVFAFEIPSGAPKLPLSLKKAYPNKNTVLIIFRLSRCCSSHDQEEARTSN